MEEALEHLENFVSCDIAYDQMEEALEQTAQTTSCRSLLGVLNVCNE